QALAWCSTARCGAIAIGPFLGGLVADRWGYRSAFVGSAIGIAVALLGGLALPVRAAPHKSPLPGATFADVRGNATVWAGWTLSVVGFLIRGVVFTFVPL